MYTLTMKFLHEILVVLCLSVRQSACFIYETISLTLIKCLIKDYTETYRVYLILIAMSNTSLHEAEIDRNCSFGNDPSY
jgi:hypothetical protein